MRLLILVSRAIQDGVFLDKSKMQGFFNLIRNQAAKFYLRINLKELLTKADEYGYVINVNDLKERLNRNNTRDMVEGILPLVRNALIQLEPDMVDFFCSGELEASAGELKNIIEHYRANHEGNKDQQNKDSLILSSCRDSSEKIPSFTTRPLSVVMPIKRKKLPRNLPEKELSLPVRPASVVVMSESRSNSLEKAPSLSVRSASVAPPVEVKKSRRDSLEKAPSPPARPVSETGMTMSVKGLHYDSLERTLSPVALSRFSSSSGSEFESPPESPRKGSEERSPVELREETAIIDNNSPNPIQVVPGAFSFFEKQPDTFKKIDSHKAQEKPNSIFVNDNVEQKREELLDRIRKRKSITKKEIQQMLVLAATGNSTGLYLLAQAVYKGDGGLEKDAVAAYYLAKLALNRTNNIDSQKKIMNFMGNVPLRDPHAKCSSGLKIRIYDQDYNPRELWNAYSEQKSAVQASAVSMRCSQ